MKQKCIIQTQFDFVGDFFAQNHSTFRQGIPLRLWKRFDFGSTFKPARLWERGVKRRTLTAAPSGPADDPQDGPSWAKCAFWVHISLNNDLANIKLTLHRILNFESCKKAQKCIKKRLRRCWKRWNSFDFQTDSTFVRLCPPGSRWGMQSPRATRRGKSTCSARWVIWRGVICLHRAPAALGSPARYSFGCSALHALHHRGFVRRPLLWAVL